MYPTNYSECPKVSRPGTGLGEILVQKRQYKIKFLVRYELNSGPINAQPAYSQRRRVIANDPGIGTAIDRRCLFIGPLISRLWLRRAGQNGDCAMESGAF